MTDTAVLVWSGLIGIASSLAASAAFLIILSTWRPKLDISSVISKDKDPWGNVRYVFKVVNLTRRPVTNVKLRMTILTPESVQGGWVYRLEDLKLKVPQMMEIARFDRDDKDANYAVRFTILEDLDRIWTQEGASKLRLEVYATHSLTGFGKSFVKEYDQRSTALKEGGFKFGKSLEIV